MESVWQSSTNRSLRTESATRPPNRKRWPDCVVVGGVDSPYRGNGVLAAMDEGEELAGLRA